MTWAGILRGTLAVVALAACRPDGYLDSSTSSARVAYNCQASTVNPLDTAIVGEHARRILRHLRVQGTDDQMRPLVLAEAKGGAAALAREVVRYVCAEGVVPRDILEPTWPEPGSVMTPFSLPRVDTVLPYPIVDTLSSAALAGSVLVIDFFSTWCVPCLDLHPRVARIAEEYGPQSVRFFTVIYADSIGPVVAFSREHGGLGIPILVEEGSGLAAEWEVFGLPRTFIIGADGRLARSHISSATIGVLPRLLDSLLGVRSVGEPRM